MARPTLEQLRALVVEPCPLVGCIRKNQWDTVQWRNVRGDSVLAGLAHMRVPLDTPVGPFSVYAYGSSLLQFRGGPWRDWWADDCRLLAAIAMEYLSGSIEGVSVVHEVDGTLDLKYIDAPARDEAQRLVRLALDSWQAEARIAKNTPRAGAVCRYCRVKARCDARDLETGATTDWPSDYKVG